MPKESKKILIVEDEASMLRLLSDRFISEGFIVLEAKNGEEGLKSALENHPNLVLIDIIMPVLDGIAMLKKLRQDSWGKNVPAIMLTNLSDSAKIAEVLESGAYDYLVKSDCKLEDIVKRVKEKLGIL